jgi:predicted metal-dependent hydrolase
LTGPSDSLDVAGLDWPVVVQVHPRARRLRLRLDERRGTLRLTCPPRTSKRAAIAWAAEQSAWVAAQVAQVRPAAALQPGLTIPIEGVETRLEWRAAESRTVRRDSGLMWCGGPAEGFDRRIARWIRAEAARVLSLETAEYAARAGVTVSRVSIGDATTRWGSCSSDGRIRFNVRLFFAPVHVRRYVVAHEVAHRVHMDHGPAFRALEETLFGEPVAGARLALRRIGPGLKRIILPR